MRAAVSGAKSNGVDFSQVRIYTDARAAESANAVNALAYSVGNDIVFGPSQYAPETTDGRYLLAHELAHVVQQRTGVVSTPGLIQRKCSEHKNMKFYENAKNYCKDDPSTGQLHADQICFRQFPLTRSSYKDCPPGDHVCFCNEPDGREKCEDHQDKVSPVASKKNDGTCKLHFQCALEHASKDPVIPGFLKKHGIDPEGKVTLPGEERKGEFL